MSGWLDGRALSAMLSLSAAISAPWLAGCGHPAAPVDAPVIGGDAATPLPVIHRIDAVVAAKRAPPSPVPPVVVDGVRYAAPHFSRAADGMSHNGGYVEATRVADGARVWLREIYRYTPDPAVEGDVQDVFITAIAVDGASLVVRDERGAGYRVAR